MGFLLSGSRNLHQVVRTKLGEPAFLHWRHFTTKLWTLFLYFPIMSAEDYKTIYQQLQRQLLVCMRFVTPKTPHGFKHLSQIMIRLVAACLHHKIPIVGI
jgi:hypothetical protein